MATNRSIWQDEPGVPGVIREGPIPSTLEDRKLLLKVQSWALNPCDAMLQDKSLPFITYPVILGQDVAGIVERVGSTASSKFKVGDRVFGFTINNGFQDYVVLNHTMACKIPESLSFSDVSIFPLCISTSSYALFGKDFLALPRPTLKPTCTSKSILIWGGSSAVGSNAIQLKPQRQKVFDHNSPSVTDDVAAELDKGTCAGIYLTVGKVADACQVSHKSKQKLFVASSNPVMPGDAPEGVEAKMTFSTGGIDALEEIFHLTFGGFLPEALTKDLYKVAPRPEVVSKKGLEGIQEALDILKKGVSAKKLVVEAS